MLLKKLKFGLERVQKTLLEKEQNAIFTASTEAFFVVVLKTLSQIVL